MRSIAHPGKSDAQHIIAVPATARLLSEQLSVGKTLLHAATEVMEKNAAKSGAFTLNGGKFTSFSYVMPALSTSPDHAVYFSETFHVDGLVALETASVTYGLKDGQPWLHCHAVWIEPDGRRHGGHLLPDKVMVAEPIDLVGVALDAAAFTVRPDPETNFSLFVPQALFPRGLEKKSPCHQAREAIALRLAPNIDICTALEDFCRDQGISHATVFGGVGSTVGAVFQDGHIVEPFVTELLIRSGHIKNESAGQPHAEIDISIVDYSGGLTEGRLAKGSNPVLVTLELVICPDH